MNSFRSHMIIILMLNNYRSIILSHFNPQNDISPFTGDENIHLLTHIIDRIINENDVNYQTQEESFCPISRL